LFERGLLEMRENIVPSMKPSRAAAGEPEGVYADLLSLSRLQFKARRLESHRPHPEAVPRQSLSAREIKELRATLAVLGLL